MIRLAPYMLVKDDRGSFRGITQQTWAEVNYIETRAGEVRGNHYHARTRELFFIVSGRVEVIVENLHSGTRQVFSARKGDAFIVEPFEVHTFTTRTKAQWINMLSRRLDPDEPDFHRPRRSR